jgi:SAM-dependent methyltransferase
VHPSSITSPIISALDHHPKFSRALKLASNIETDSKTSYQLLAKQLSTIPLFLRLMEVTPINDLKIEQLLTSLRKSMLQEAIMGNLEEEGLPFASALALQCFTNEYAYYETDEETSSIERLQQQITELIEQTRDVQPILIATLGAYRPLHTFPWAQKLADYEWDNDISVVINRQILEPFTERSLRSQITNLTPIKDLVSQSVREQYEENPYPRWINPGLVDKGKPIGTVLRGLQFDIGNYQSPETPDILIAGCGTGQHAIETASRYKNSQVLAMDLSLSSLSYAKRKTNELNISNIEYTQADIMELGSLDRKFDLIESAGVLHHLGDPLAGWKVLVDLLRPGGLMKIGLYSEAARQSVVEGRSIIADKEYTTSPEDIRQCRQDIVALTNRGHAKLEGILNFKDFFSLSECRDLLFHVQEHRFTLPQIKTALKSLKLKFLGFEMQDQSIRRKFKETYPKKSALTSLTKWHEFELKNPDTFISMYQFWCQKK